MVKNISYCHECPYYIPEKSPDKADMKIKKRYPYMRYPTNKYKESEAIFINFQEIELDGGK